jgi:7-carboxy-7-deazaguanine synthase
MSLEISEIFRSIQGESSYAGLPCSFVRLSGCNLRCRYCDTHYAQDPGSKMSLEAITEKLDTFGCQLVEITGGEPLFQSETPGLISRLIDKGYKVLVETNGSYDIAQIPKEAIAIMDLKCPSSGEMNNILWENIWKLKPNDEIKFVISDRHDYEWALGIIRERFGNSQIQILLSVVFGELPPGRLVQWMLEDKLQARFQLQIHKYIWPHDTRGV